MLPQFDTFTEKVFSEVKAILAPTLIENISGNVEDFLQTNSIPGKLCSSCHSQEVCHELTGTLSEILFAHSKLEAFLQSQPCLTSDDRGRSSQEADAELLTSDATESNKENEGDSDSSQNSASESQDFQHVTRDIDQAVTGESPNLQNPTIVLPSEAQQKCKTSEIVEMQRRIRIKKRLNYRTLCSFSLRKIRKTSVPRKFFKRNVGIHDSCGNETGSPGMAANPTNAVPQQCERRHSWKGCISKCNAVEFDDRILSKKLSISGASSKCGKSKPKKNYDVTSPFKYFCDLCSFKTKRISHYNKHLTIHDKVKTLYKCGQCSFTTVRLSHLRRHEMSHSNTVHQCAHCTYKTDDAKLLARHVKHKHHGSHKYHSRSEVQECNHCSYKTSSPHMFERHTRIHVSRTGRGTSFIHQCDQCCYKTCRKEHFVRHMNNVHSNKRPYLCDLCGKAFKRGDALRQHHLTHPEIDLKLGMNFNCGVCDKNFRSQSHLFEHQAVHSNIRSFLCEICGAAFKTRSVQRKHVLTIHKNPRAYSCDSCNKKFNTQYALKRHRKVHVGSIGIAQGAHIEQPSSMSVMALPMLSSSEETEQAAAQTLSVVTLAQELTVPHGTELHISEIGQDDLTSAVGVSTAIQEACVSAEVIQQLPQTFLQTTEATTLLYVTSAIPEF